MREREIVVMPIVMLLILFILLIVASYFSSECLHIPSTRSDNDFMGGTRERTMM